MQQYRELRVHTRLDEMHSALATIALAGEMAETLKEELKEQAEQANTADLIQQELQKPSMPPGHIRILRTGLVTRSSRRRLMSL